MKRHVVYMTMFIVSLWLTTNALAAVYYVKQDGNDALDGRSDATAWKTVSKVNGYSFSSGDDVYFKCNDTWTGTALNVDWSGTSGNHVVVGAYYGNGDIGVSGNKPVIDGNDSVPGEYYGLVHVTGNYVDIHNLRIVDSEGFGVRFSKVSNCNADGVETYNTAKGGIQYYSSSYGTVENSDIELYAKGWQEGLYSYWAGGITLHYSSNITIRKNSIHEGYGEGICPGYESHDITIEDNVLYACRAGHIYICGAHDNVVRRNLCYGTTDTKFHRYTGYCGFGIGVNDESWQAGAWTYNNTIEDNLIAFCKMGMWIATQHSSSSFSDSEVNNNTFVDCDINFYHGDGPWSNSYVKNNISACYDGDCDHYSGPSSTPGLTWDYNNWSSSVGSPCSGSHDEIGNPQLAKQSGWQSLSAGDLDGSEFALQDTSPAIDAGTQLGSEFEYAPECNTSNWRTGNINVISQDTQGSAWEIGADIYAENPSTLLAPTGLKIVAP